MTLEQMFSRIENISYTETRNMLGEDYPLRTLISDLEWKSNREVLSGILSFETLQSVPQIDGRATVTKQGTRVMFSLFHGAIVLYLVSFARRSVAENSAGKLNYILNMGESLPHQIVFNCFIPTDVIENFLADHPHTKKLENWKNLTYPGVNKASLHGADVDQFNHAREYDAHGEKSNVLVVLHRERMVLRISDKGVISFYSNLTLDAALEWIRNELVTLLP
jgi:hypothetical protein